MGLHPDPSYANIFMAKLDQIVKLANKYKITLMSAPYRPGKDFLMIVLESGQILLRNYINS